MILLISFSRRTRSISQLDMGYNIYDIGKKILSKLFFEPHSQLFNTDTYWIAGRVGHRLRASVFDKFGMRLKQHLSNNVDL